MSPPAMVMAAPASAWAQDELKSTGGTITAATRKAIWKTMRSGSLSPLPSPRAVRSVTISPPCKGVSRQAARATGRPSIAAIMWAPVALPLRCMSARAPGSMSPIKSASVAPGGTTAGTVSRPAAVSGCGQ